MIRTMRTSDSAFTLSDCLAALLITTLFLTATWLQGSKAWHAFNKGDVVLNQETTLLDWSAKDLAGCQTTRITAGYQQLSCHKSGIAKGLFLLVPE